MTPTCSRCGALEAIVHVTLNRGGPRHIEWCQRCYDAFRVWASLPPEPVLPAQPAVFVPFASTFTPTPKPKAKKPAPKPKAGKRSKRG